MDDRIAKAAQQARASIKEAIGKLTGNAKAEVEGAAEKAASKTEVPTPSAQDKVS